MRTMAKVIIVIGAALFLAAPVHAQLFKKGLQIGYVDVAKIFDQYNKTDIATEKLKKDIEEKKKDIEKRKENINLLKQKLETQGVVISEAEKAKMQEEFESKIKELKDITEKFNQELRSQEQQFVRDILEDIKETIKVYGKDNGYDLILDNREVLYGPEGMDITDEIVNIINKKQKSK